MPHSKPRRFTPNQFFFLFHLIFAIVAALTLTIAPPVDVPVRMLILMGFYWWSVLVAGQSLGDALSMRMFAFLMPLSIFMVFPDWFLVSVLGTLQFPEDNSPAIGAVPAYMAGLWLVPFYVSLMTGRMVSSGFSRNPVLALTVTVLTMMILFTGSEAFSWILPSWSARNVHTWHHIALYVLPAELILAILVFVVFRMVQEKSWYTKIAAGFCVMLTYSGALNLSYFLFEKLR